MDSLFSISSLHFSSLGLPEQNINEVFQAMEQKSYPTLYAALRKYQYTFSPQGAFHLIYQALEHELNQKAILTILERCPPLEEFLFADEANIPFLDRCGLVETAAYLDRADILTLLLERGGNVNRYAGFSVSPVEAALEGPAFHCLSILAQREDLDITWTPRLYSLWSRDPDPPLLNLCLQTLVPRFFPGERSPMEPLPIPEGPGLLPPAIQNQNWPLALRAVRGCSPLPHKEGRTALDAFPSQVPMEEQPECVEVLCALLEGCPSLIRNKGTCQLLLRYWLTFPPDACQPLGPWVERIPFRKLSMRDRDWEDLGPQQLITLWNALLPLGPALVLDRWSPIFPEPPKEADGRNSLFQEFATQQFFPVTEPECLADILSFCQIQGKGRAGRISPLACTLIQHLPAALLEPLLAPGGVLAEEDPDALLDFAQSKHCPRLSRAAILSHIRKEDPYAL